MKLTHYSLHTVQIIVPFNYITQSAVVCVPSMFAHNVNGAEWAIKIS